MSPEPEHLKEIMTQFSTELLELERDRLCERIMDLEEKKGVICQVLAERAIHAEDNCVV